MDLKKSFSPSWVSILAYSGLGILFVLAILLRVSLYHVLTSDYTVFVSQWYDFIKTHGGFAAMKYSFSNYNPPYLYLLALTTFLPIPKLIAIKTLSVVFDIVLGIFTYLLIRLKYRRSYAAIIGVLVVLFAPTIFINSSAWGQCDAIYTAFCLGSLYFSLKERPGWACLFFGLALSFKLQAIFFLPVLLILLLKKRLPIQYLALIPLVFLLMLAPAFIAGRDAGSLLTVYVNQTTTGGVGNTAGQFPGGGDTGTPGFNRGDTGQSRGGTPGQFPGGNGNFNRGGTPGQAPGGNGNSNRAGRGGQSNSSSSLTLNAPSFYQWLPASAPSYWKWVGIALAGLFVILVGFLTVRSKKLLTSEIILKIALVFALAIPFLLPEMHERYFYLADVLSIVYAFYFPRYFFVAIIIQLCSLLSYAPYLQGSQIIGLAYVAIAVLIVTVITFADLVRTLYPDMRKKEVAALASPD